jgi:hypothetical protein
MGPCGKARAFRKPAGIASLDTIVFSSTTGRSHRSAVFIRPLPPGHA